MFVKGVSSTRIYSDPPINRTGFTNIKSEIPHIGVFYGSVIANQIADNVSPKPHIASTNHTRYLLNQSIKAKKMMQNSLQA